MSEAYNVEYVETQIGMPEFDVLNNQEENFVEYNFAIDKNNFIDDLYKRFSQKLKARLINMVRCKDIAEDIAHDAFLRINSLDNPESIENPWGYLFTISHNLIKDRAKALKVREKHRMTIEQKEEDSIDQLSPEYNVLAQEKFNMAVRAIENLPPKCRKVFLMHKIHNLSHKEIAETMGISKNTVEKHIVRAMVRCHASMSRFEQCSS